MEIFARINPKEYDYNFKLTKNKNSFLWSLTSFYGKNYNYLLYKEYSRNWSFFNFHERDLKMDVVPQNSPTTCGQACIATLLRISLGEAIKIVGHDGITSDEEIAKALSNYVVLNFVEGEPTEGTALQKHRSPDGKREHWTIYDRGKVLDPASHKKLWAVYKYARLD